MPEFRDPEAGRLDLVSAGLSVVAVLAVIFGLKEIATHGFEGMPLLSIVLGLAVGAVFVQRQRAARPADRPPPLPEPHVQRVLAANTLSLAIAFGIFLFIAQYLQLVLGYSPLSGPLDRAFGRWVHRRVDVAPLLVRIARPAHVVAGGFALTAAGLGLLTQVEADSSVRRSWSPRSSSRWASRRPSHSEPIWL